MNVTEWYNSRKGQSLLVPGADPADRGQCVQAADYALNEIYGLPYVWANAVDWWNLPGSLAGNFDQITDGSVKQGDFVIYSEGLVKYGHIDIAAQDGSTSDYIGYDSNWGGNKTLHQVHHNQPKYNQYILGVLRLKGGDMPEIVTPDQIKILYHDLCGGLVPTQSQIDFFINAKQTFEQTYFAVQKDPQYILSRFVNDGDIASLAEHGIDASGTSGEFYKPATFKWKPINQKFKPYDGKQLFTEES